MFQRGLMDGVHINAGTLNRMNTVNEGVTVSLKSSTLPDMIIRTYFKKNYITDAKTNCSATSLICQHNGKTLNKLSAASTNNVKTMFS